MGDTTEAKKSQSSADASKKTEPKTLMEAMEEDDQFEEFESEHWGKNEIEEETQQWMDNWDDDMDDDFTKNLREELNRASEKK
jgi:26 proteasome complex subunit DSS1